VKIKKWAQIIFIGLSVLTLAACATRHKPDQSSIDEANAAYNNNGAQASGLGQEANFGDHAQGRMRHSASRIYYFDFDSNVVHDADKPAIAANADYLLSHPNAKVMLEGHTDPRGSREYNIGLGERRAKAVAHILIVKGVNPTQIRIVSYGAEKLATPGRTEADYQRDRRVVLAYLRR
jgi:peptidoglycan-associated lipoprotein